MKARLWTLLVASLFLACGEAAKPSAASAGSKAADAGPREAKDQPEPPAPKEEPAEPSAPAGDPAHEDEAAFAVMRGEAVEGIKVDMTAADVAAELGEPKTRTPIEEESATGAWVSVWAYPDRGIELGISADTQTGPQTVSSITIGKTSNAKTSRGIGIGSTLAELEKAYGTHRDDEASTEDSFIAGSIYGGIAFSLDDQQKVSSIFIGPMAE